MRIADANFLLNVLNCHLPIVEEYFVAPDVRSELTVDPRISSNKLINIRDAKECSLFDERSYLVNYQKYINKHPPSFYNMTSFGDISTLAFIETVLRNIGKQLSLQGLEDRMVLYSDDAKLNTRCKREFGADVDIVSFSEARKFSL